MYDGSSASQRLHTIIHETNGCREPTSGRWQAEEPVAEIVRDAVIQGLTAARAPIVDSSETVILTEVKAMLGGSRLQIPNALKACSLA
jgi:hypothetical protein